MKNSPKQSILGALAISTALALTVFAGPSYAADGAKVITSSSDKVKVSITGQINRTILYYDDDFNDGVRHMDNDYSSTRFRWNADARVNNDIKIGGLIEIAAINNSNASTNQDTEGTGDTASLTDRHLEFWVDHAR
ncbi:MAG: porin, partial [Rickettsiales bacterium]